MKATVHGRRYRILEVLGEGGFGRVYKARLEDDQGFAKDVAIKIGEADAPEPVLKRFRDEARILGLVRDRAIVAVEPPTRVGSRWAVVMEYVEGSSLQALLAARSKLPPRVALGIVQEVSRALDSIYGAVGRDGNPIRLVHRDLKPANLQITRSGEVKILDFGLARADFEGREADSTTNIGGTLGYIAPERLEGVEGPAGDVYSLGVVLRTLITGVGPRHWRKFSEEGSTLKDADELLARALAEEMTSMEPAERPTARQVEERCAQATASMRGPTLRTWALEHVRAEARPAGDRLVGSVLSETLANVPVGVEDSQNLVRGPSSRGFLLAATMGSIGTLVGGTLAVVALGGILWFVGTGQTPGPIRVPGTSKDIDIADVLRRSGEDEEPVIIEPEVVEVREAEPVPVARPVEKTTFPVAFGSVPAGAEVFLDGVSLGSTPVDPQLLPEGEHTLRLTFGFEAIEAKIGVGTNRPISYLWEVGEPLQVKY